MASMLAYARVPDKATIFTAAPELQPSKLVDVPATSVVSSPDGKLVALPTPASVAVYDPHTGEQKITINCASSYLVGFSPACNYLITCQKSSRVGGQLSKNLQVWDLSTGSAVLELSQKAVSRDAWPMLQWVHDDSTVMHMVTNTIHVYSRADNFAAFRKVSVPGLANFAISPAPVANPMVAAFLKEVKGSPAAAVVLDASKATPQAIVRRSFYRSQGARLTWNALGTAVLVIAYSETDATNQSYYGEQQLHYLPADPARADSSCRIELKDGPVHDVQWSPTGDHFVVVAGFMPAKVALFDAKCKPVYDLGSGPYNMVRWNPFGRFLAIAGFGNLPGDVVFFDKKSSGQCKQMGAMRAPSVDCSWSPDGRHLLAMVTAPRLRVDNSLKVFTYYGEKVYEQPYDILLDAGWLPAPAGAYADRPQSPGRVAAGDASGTAGSSKAQTVQEKAYVAPHMRGRPGAAAEASGRFSMAREEDDAPGRFRPGPKAGPPGAEFVTKAASKNAKKRANKKKQAGGDDGEEGAEAGAAQAVTKQVAAMSVQEAAPSGGQEGQESDAAKRIRNLQKKLRQVQQLKDKMAEKGRAAMEPEQLQKIEGEAAILAELKQLGA